MKIEPAEVVLLDDWHASYRKWPIHIVMDDYVSAMFSAQEVTGLPMTDIPVDLRLEHLRLVLAKRLADDVAAMSNHQKMDFLSVTIRAESRPGSVAIHEE